MSDIIGIIIFSTPITAKCISIIREHRPSSISEIRQNILSNEYAISIDYTDAEGLSELIICCNELLNNNIAFEIYEHERKCDLDFLNNLSLLYTDIAKQIDEEMAFEDETN